VAVMGCGEQHPSEVTHVVNLSVICPVLSSHQSATEPAILSFILEPFSDFFHESSKFPINRKPRHVLG